MDDGHPLSRARNGGVQFPRNWKTHTFRRLVSPLEVLRRPAIVEILCSKSAMTEAKKELIDFKSVLNDKNSPKLFINL